MSKFRFDPIIAYNPYEVNFNNNLELASLPMEQRNLIQIQFQKLEDFLNNLKERLEALGEGEVISNLDADQLTVTGNELFNEVHRILDEDINYELRLSEKEFNFIKRYLIDDKRYNVENLIFAEEFYLRYFKEVLNDIEYNFKNNKDWFRKKPATLINDVVLLIPIHHVALLYQLLTDSYLTNVHSGVDITPLYRQNNGLHCKGMDCIEVFSPILRKLDMIGKIFSSFNYMFENYLNHKKEMFNRVKTDLNVMETEPYPTIMA